MEIHEAAEAGDTQRVKDLLDEPRGLLRRKPNVDARDKHGFTPLHFAAMKGHVGICALLLDHGADIHAREELGETPLHRAAMWGANETVSLLLGRGADVNARATNGATPLHMAVASLSDHTDTAELLLLHGADTSAQTDDGMPLLHAAVTSRRTGIAAMLLDRGVDVNARWRNNNMTPLHLAVQKGCSDMVSLLLERGADMEAPDEARMPLLHVAAQWGHDEVVALRRPGCGRGPAPSPARG